MPRLRSLATTVLLLALTSVAACGGNGAVKRLASILKAEEKPCPAAVVVAEARNIYDLAPGGSTPEHLRVAGRITVPVAECKYRKGKIAVELDLPFEAARGPVLKKGRLTLEFPYFVAIADRYDNILGKETFVATIKLGGDQERAGTVEKIEQVIPLGPEQDGSHFVIYVGFQLTPDQVEFNRRHRL